MKSNLLVFFLLAGGGAGAQCPDINVNLKGGHCVGDTLYVASSGRMEQITWYNNGQVVKTVNSSLVAPPETIVAGGNSTGTAPNQLFLPAQIYISAADSLYVSDMENWRIEVFPPGSTQTTNGNKEVLPSLLEGDLGNEPVCSGLYRDSHGNLYAEEGPDIVKWGPDAIKGVFIAKLSPTAPYTNSWDQSKLYIDAADNLYVIEPGNNRIQKWAPGASAGVTVIGGNGPGSAANQLYSPQGMFIDKSGNIYVADTYNNRVQKWAPGASAGVTVAGGMINGSDAGSLTQPKAVWVDVTGNIYVVDTDNDRVQLWAPGATAGVTVMGGNGQGSALNQLFQPDDVFMDDKGYLYVCDRENSRVVKNIPQPIYSIDSTLVTDTPGTYTAVVISNGGCTLTMNSIVVSSTAHPDLVISGAPNPVCSNDSVVFAAQLMATGLAPVYQWWVDGTPVGSDSPGFVDRMLSGGDVVYCTAKDEVVCTSAVSDSVVLTVNPAPGVTLGQIFPLVYGGSETLTPQVSGDIVGYTWSPAAGLSDTSILNPAADPRTTTVYTLSVVGSDGCVAEAGIKVDVYTELRIPNAFTPNGDGRNDVFYVLGGPPDLVLKEFAVFNRWGQCLFSVHDVPAGDPAYGWDGRANGGPAPIGTYVYVASTRRGDGQVQTYRGTVELIRW
jgi:gliding motility-associated-like protein